MRERHHATAAKTILVLVSWFIVRTKKLAWVRQKVNLCKISMGVSKSLELTDQFSVGDLVCFLKVHSCGL